MPPAAAHQPAAHVPPEALSSNSSGGERSPRSRGLPMRRAARLDRLCRRERLRESVALRHGHPADSSMRSVRVRPSHPRAARPLRPPCHAGRRASAPAVVGSVILSLTAPSFGQGSGVGATRRTLCTTAYLCPVAQRPEGPTARAPLPFWPYFALAVHILCIVDVVYMARSGDRRGELTWLIA